MFLKIFITVFLAELGDKTQIATFLYATNEGTSKSMVFLASAAALVLASALAVLLGSAVQDHLEPRYLSWAAGVGFIAIGIWTLVRS